MSRPTVGPDASPEATGPNATFTSVQPLGVLLTHHVYVLRCSDGTLYTGYTTDVERRVGEHDQGDGAKYTRGRTPVELVHTESFETRSRAMKREAEIKAMSRDEKLAIVAASGSAPEPTSG